MKDWSEILNKYSICDLVEGTVILHRHYGVFLDIGEEDIWGFIDIGQFIEYKAITSDKFPAIGSKVTAVIVAFDESAKEIRLSVKPSTFRYCGIK